MSWASNSLYDHHQFPLNHQQQVQTHQNHNHQRYQQNYHQKPYQYPDSMQHQLYSDHRSSPQPFQPYQNQQQHQNAYQQHPNYQQYRPQESVYDHNLKKQSQKQVYHGQVTPPNPSPHPTSPELNPYNPAPPTHNSPYYQSSSQYQIQNNPNPIYNGSKSSR